MSKAEPPLAITLRPPNAEPERSGCTPPPNAAPKRSEDAGSSQTEPTHTHISSTTNHPANPTPDTRHPIPDTPHTPQRSHGVVMVITLLAIMLIASLVFYVINVGTSVQGRIVTQHAADAAAIGGASQVARSLNTVAMNNVETAKIIVAVSMLDSLPLAIDMSITDPTEEELGDTDAVGQAISGQLRAGVVDLWFQTALRKMMDPNDPQSVSSAQRYLRELDDLFRNQPDFLPNMTWYITPSGQMGKMHQAMRSLDAHSRAVMQTLSETAQSAATRSTQANLGNNDTNNAGLLLPASLTIPWQRGVFDDFERPVKKGLLPGADRDLVVDSVSKGFGQIDNEVTQRGPWDALFGWRTTDRITGSSASAGGAIPGFPGPPVASSPSPGGTTTSREPEKYFVFGPESFMLGTRPRYPYSLLDQKIWELYSIKANYLWPGTTTRTVLDPNWEIDIARDNERSSDRNDDYAYGVNSTDIRQTAFVIAEIKSRISNDPGLPARQGVTWNYISGRRTPFVHYAGGWQDPRNGPPIRINPRSVTSGPTWRKIQKHIWRISATYDTNPNSPNLGGDPAIGLPPKRTGTDANGNPTYAAQEVYWEIDVMLVGVNVGKDVDVNNPWAGFDRNSFDAPAPIDIDHNLLRANNADDARQYLTFLGLARKTSRPAFWPTRFNGDRAYPYNSAIAQARIFNNHSFDLWTQTWQAKLQPVTDFNDWVDQAGDAASASQNNPNLDPNQVEQMSRYLRSVQSLAPVMLNH
jgi:hypothetical protein